MKQNINGNKMTAIINPKNSEISYAMEEMESTIGQTNENRESTVQTYRKTLNQTIITVFADLHKDPEMLEKLMKCIKHGMEDFPEIFVHPSKPFIGSETELQTARIKQNVCKEFTVWLVNHLLELLNNPICQPSVKQTCEQLIASLISLVKLRDLSLFSFLVNELITTATDLVIIKDKFSTEVLDLSDCVLKRFILNKEKTTEEKEDDLDIKYSFVYINNSKECEEMQISLIEIFKHLMPTILPFIDIRSNLVLWNVFCYNLEVGCLQLKQVVLELFSMMIKSGKIPMCLSVQNYFSSCLISIIEYILQGNIQISLNAVELEEALSECLENIYLEEEDVLLGLKSALSLEMLENIIEIITVQGFSCIKTKLFKDNLGNFLCFLLRSQGNIIYNKSLSEKFLKTMMDCSFKTGYAEWITRFLYVLLCEEIEYNLNKNILDDNEYTVTGESNVNLTSCTWNGDKTSMLQYKTAKIPSEELADHFKQEHMLLWSQYHTRVQELFNSITEKLDNQVLPSALEFDLLQTLTETLVLCIIQYAKHSNTSVSSEHCDFFISLTQSFIENIFIHFNSIVEKIIMHFYKVSMNNFERYYETILLVYAAFLCIQDQITSENWIFVAIIISLPWISMADKSSVPSDWMKILTNMKFIEISWGLRVISTCIHLLATLSSNVIPEWRINIYKEILYIIEIKLWPVSLTYLKCLKRHLSTGNISSFFQNLLIKNSENYEYSLVAVELFPHFLHQMENHREQLLKIIQYFSITLHEENIQINLANKIGILTCIMADKTGIIKDIHRFWPQNKDSSSKQFSQASNLAKILKVVCHSCGSIQPAILERSTYNRNDIECPSNKYFNETQPISVDFTSIQSFLQLISHPKKEVKLGITNSLKSVFLHLPPHPSLLSQCLKLMEDSAYEIRYAFSQSISYYMMYPRVISSNSEETIVARLISAITNAENQNKIDYLETILLTIGQIGYYASTKLLLIVIMSLLKHVMSNYPLISATAHSELRKISQVRNTSMISLFQQFRCELCKKISDMMLNAQSVDEHAVLEILYNVVNVFGFKDIKSFLSQALRFLLPFVVTKASAESSALLKLFAKQQFINRREMIVNNFKYIFAHLNCFCSHSEMETALRYIQKETDIEIGSLLRCDYQRTHNELLLYISCHYEKVFSGLKVLASYDENYHGAENITKPEQMAEYLHPRLLGFLAFFDSQLLNSNTPQEEKQLVLQSLIAVMKLMGQKYITPVRMKIMATLRNALMFKDESLLTICCLGWNIFVHSVEESVLGPMLSQIIVTLVPVLQKRPNEIAEIFKFLIEKNKEHLKDNFQDLYFIPDIPELIEVRKLLKEYVQKTQSQDDFRSLLVHSFKRITHENADVRFQALTQLKHLLSENKVVLNDYILGNDTVDPIIPQLIKTIMVGCRDSNVETRILIGECLGELGAVDPGRLDIKFSNPQIELMKIHSSVEEDDFAYSLIQEIVRAFLAAGDTRIQDCSSYALQELLSFYGCKLSEDNIRTGNALWNRFSPDVQDILAPLLNSRYILSSEAKSSNIPKPIYNSIKGRTFKDWVCNWTGYLITKVINEKASKIFVACSMIIKHDVAVALHLLPYVVLCNIQNGSEDVKIEILSEIETILSQDEKSEFAVVLQSDLRHMSTQTIFSILDYLIKWIRKTTRKLESLTNAKNKVNSETGLKDIDQLKTQLSCIQEFLKQIPQSILARASYQCQAYNRALMHLEAYIKNNRQCLQSQLGFLQKLYMALDEMDGVAGVEALRQEEPKFNEQILVHESTGQLQDALACYEKAIQVEADDVTHYQGLLRCLMGIDQPSTALSYATGVIFQRPEWTQILNQYRIEAAWKLGKWDALESFLKCNEENSNVFGVEIGKIFYASKSKDNSKYVQLLQNIRREQMAPLSAASMENGAYQRGYEYLVRLHIINELENGIELFSNLSSSTVSVDGHLNNLNSLEIFKKWNSRIRLVQQSLRTLEPILNVRRTILELIKDSKPYLAPVLDYHIGSSWLLSAKVARKGGHQQRAYSSLLEASRFNIKDIFVEKAKWLWNKNEHEQAIITLQKGISEHYPDSIHFIKENSSSTIKEHKFVFAKAKLLLARYSEESANVESSAIIKMFKEVQELYHEWEDGHFYLAQYYDRIFSKSDNSSSRDKKYDLTFNIIKCYGQSLQYGCQYIYHSMPRLLSLWLDLGTQAAEADNKKKSQTSVENLDKALTAVNLNLISVFRETLPSYLFLTAFPQLISRICHSRKDVFTELKEIIAKLLTHFPQQGMWMMMAVSKSSYPIRVKRCQEIFAHAKELKPELQKFFSDATKFTDRLLELCNKTVEQNVTKLSIPIHFKNILRLIDNQNFSKIMVPLQSTMTVTLPNASNDHSVHNPFPHSLVYIEGFEDTVEILPSLQKPKKISMRGSDGKVYIAMCKPKDDLRKDCRLMEFNSLVNKSLLRNAESRRRELHIRTYSVVPLNEECGLIEWVPNLVGIRHALNAVYKEKKMVTSMKDLKQYIVPKSTSFEQKLAIFKTKLLPRFPPVFDEWFLHMFPDPTAWYMARLAYARTTAVMSMVGYIVGLGDRHGENILIDSSCGDTVHVDFNCLFNKGETFDWPERVPFRLTHNMIAAMGPTGYEGVYRKSCEVTLKVIRNQMETLMSVLKPFIHDPLVEWSKSAKATRGNPSESGEINNEKALTHVRDIELRLKGIIKSKKSQGLPLSIEGQVNHLIQEATSENNLCQMYVGWAAYM